MVLLFTLISFSLFGFVEWGQRFSVFANRFARHHGSSTAFATGVLATLVATLDVAIYYRPGASAQHASPAHPADFCCWGWPRPARGGAIQLAIAAATSALPGAWMEHFKQLLGFPLLASALWLLWVLGRQQGMAAVFHVLSWLLLAGFTLWAWGRVGRWGRLLFLLLNLAAAVWLFACPSLVVNPYPRHPPHQRILQPMARPLPPKSWPRCRPRASPCSSISPPIGA
jgi:thiol:disulfide interchange protein DsbD